LGIFQFFSGRGYYKRWFEIYNVDNISPDTSFLEMLDILNNNLIREGKEPVVFDHDCREGICGMCSLYINGRAHAPDEDITTWQLHARKFKDGTTITVELWRLAAFPVMKDLVVNRNAFDQMLQAGGFISVKTGGVPDANAIPIAKDDAEESMDVSACIGCGACVATCKNGSAMLFIAARVSALAKLPQGKFEAAKRVKAMIVKMDELGFGSCTNTQAYQAEYHNCARQSQIVWRYWYTANALPLRGQPEPQAKEVRLKHQ
jgi:succinate dehydrogenase / fumarate reductase iron-sulfur subunit